MGMGTEVLGGARALIEVNARDAGKDMTNLIISLNTKIGMPTDPI